MSTILTQHKHKEYEEYDVEFALCTENRHTKSKNNKAGHLFIFVVLKNTMFINKRIKYLQKILTPLQVVGLLDY